MGGLGGKKGLLLKYSLLWCLLLGLIGGIPFQVTAQEKKAKSDANEFQLEEIVVTGSRIQRRDYESNSPMVTIKADAFQQQTGLNVESYLNQLPEYNPAASPVTTQQDVQITPVNSVGVATISLRGFGPNRSLTLVDGKRVVPTNALMWVDVNGIPSALIDRVETISGGASAVYGADAVGGVTNFILKKDFEGFQLDAQYGIQEAGGGQESDISMLFGSNLADDRGNVTFGVEYYKRKKALARDRDWYIDRWTNPSAAGYFFFLQGTNGYDCAYDCPNVGSVKALFGGQSPAAWYYAGLPDSATMPSMEAPFYGPQYFFNQDGTIFTTGNPVAEAKSKIKDGLLYADSLSLSNQDMAGETTYLGTKWNYLDQWASAPQDRYSIYANGNYKLTDKLKVFGSGRFTQSRTRTNLFGTDAIAGWEATVPYNPTTDSPIDPNLDYRDPAVLAAVAANPTAYFAAHPNPNFIPTGATGAGHPVVPELAWLLNSRGTPIYEVDAEGNTVLDPNTHQPVQAKDAQGLPLYNSTANQRWQPQWYPTNSLPPRSTVNSIQTWQIEGGLDFELPFRDWNGEFYVSHGESATYNVAGGDLSLARYRALVNLPDYGRGADYKGNQWYTVESENGLETVNTIRPAFGVASANCTSGLYNSIFFDQPMSEDCFNSLYAVVQTRTEITQDIYELNLQGGLFNLPAGEVRTAFGWQYRKVGAIFNPDILQSEDSFLDQVVGVYPTGYMDASTTVNDYYAEALIPVLHDLPFIQKFELETGARYSDYRNTGQKEWTYKVLANWQVKDWLRLRGGYNRAIRAPNIGELYLGLQEIFTGAGAFGDPCSVRSNSPWGAGGTTLATDPIQTTPTELPPAVAPGQTQAGANRTEQICEAMMGATGANNYYRSGGDVVQQTGGSPFAWVNQEGNPLLKPEKADTWTAGFVLSSPWMNPWVSGITLAFDWYNILINDAIMTYSVDFASYRCFGLDTGLTPAEQALTPACLLTPRDQNNGGELDTVLSYDNQAWIRTRGYDIAFNWFANLSALGWDVPGNIGFNVHATVLDTYKTRQSPAPFDVPTEWKGSLGPTLPGTQGGAYDYRLFTSLTYSQDEWSVSLRWRHLPKVYSAGYNAQQALIENNARVAAGGEGILLGYTPSTEIETKSYDKFDLSGVWEINKTFQVRAGIDNLFDTAPPYVASTTGYPPGTDKSQATVCGDAPGCSAPNGYSLNSVGNFNAGYYDTLGRRYFMGLKVRF